MLRRNLKIFGLVPVLAFALMLTACSGDTGTKNLVLGGKDIEIPYDDAGSTVRSLVMAEVFKEVGYKVTLTQVESAGSLFASTSVNKDAVNVSGWFPTTHKDYLDKYGDNLEVYKKTNFIDEVSLSLAVPAYMDTVKSMKDLKDNKEFGDSVDRTITGIDPRSGIMEMTDKAIESNDYGLGKWTLKEGSEQAMIAELTEKYKNEQPIIITGWTPHWIFDNMEMKMLDDPQGVYGNGEDHINLVFNKEFKSEHPAAYRIATRMAADWKQEDESLLMKLMFVKGGNKQKVAQDYIDRNSNKLDSWIENIEKE